MSETPKETDALPELLEIMQRLRDPENGCDWDKQQTFRTIAPYTIEEAYEVAHAIEMEDYAELKDELGDLLLQVVFHARIAEELGLFDFHDVSQAIVDKMIRRHPHVFGNVKYASIEEQKAAWEAIKAQEKLEKAERSKASVSIFSDISKQLPALMRAYKTQQRAARVGFDWDSPDPVWEKLTEEIAEFKEAVESGQDHRIQDELGDLLFTVVNLARHHSQNPESALQEATHKFASRFAVVEQLASERKLVLDTLSLEELDTLWEEAKSKLQPVNL